MSNLSFCFWVGLLMFPFSTVLSQSVDSLARTLEESVKKKPVKWYLDRKEVKPKEASYHWYDGDKGVVIYLVECNSAEEAARRLILEDSIYMKPIKTKLVDYGDEAYLYRGKKDSADGKIILRQANYFITVSAARLNDAKGFAKELYEMVKEKKKAK
jgi:hypothetical protein